MSNVGSSAWYQDLVGRLSRGTLTPIRAATFAPWEVTVLVEEHDLKAIARTERLLAVFVPTGTRAHVLSLRSFEDSAHALRTPDLAIGD